VVRFPRIVMGLAVGAALGASAAIVLVALLTGVAVAFCGIIAFVGLVVPHVIRMAIGPSHRPLIRASAVGGGTLLTIERLYGLAVEVLVLPIDP
jgi:ABC-type Fe3+-siderophore transport system permease subunit